MEAGAVGTRPVGAPRGILRVWGDDRLVARVRGGDDRAFEAIYDRHHRGLLSFCRHMLGSREEAEDALQHTFASAYRALLRSDAPIQLKAWLYAIARNHCLSVLRVRREATVLEEDAAGIEGLAEEVERRGELRALVGDLQQLPHDQRAALVLTELGAHSHEEIGLILGVRRDKVKALVFQARESLIASREARETPCRDIREQLSVLRGGSLRRTSLRRHVAACDGCREFRAEVARQRSAMALVLPVAPSMALKGAVLGPILGAGAGAACVATAGVGAGVTTAASTVGPGLSLAGKSIAAKALVAAAVAGVGGGAVAAEEIHRHTTPEPHKAPAKHAGRAAPAAVSPGGNGLPAAPVAPAMPMRLTPLPAPVTGAQGAAGHPIEENPTAGDSGPFVVVMPPVPTAVPLSIPVVFGPVGGAGLDGETGDDGDGFDESFVPGAGRSEDGHHGAQIPNAGNPGAGGKHAGQDAGKNAGKSQGAAKHAGKGQGAAKHAGKGEGQNAGGKPANQGDAQNAGGKPAEHGNAHNAGGKPAKHGEAGGNGSAQGQGQGAGRRPGDQGAGGDPAGQGAGGKGDQGKHAAQGAGKKAGQGQGAGHKQADQGNGQGAGKKAGQGQGAGHKQAGQGAAGIGGTQGAADPVQQGGGPGSQGTGNQAGTKQPGGQPNTKPTLGAFEAGSQSTGSEDAKPGATKPYPNRGQAKRANGKQDPAQSPQTQGAGNAPAGQNGAAGSPPGQKNKQARTTPPPPPPPAPASVPPPPPPPTVEQSPPPPAKKGKAQGQKNGGRSTKHANDADD